MALPHDLQRQWSDYVAARADGSDATPFPAVLAVLNLELPRFADWVAGLSLADQERVHAAMPEDGMPRREQIQ
jgi:hypothetical protein